MQQPTSPASLPTTEEWRTAIQRFQEPSLWRAIGQLADTLLPIAGLWIAISYVAPISLWLALPLAVLIGALLVRTFIIFHDCGHGSFFRSRRANDIVGFVTGLLTFTPYFDWRYEHAKHHATSGDLDRRGTGDVWVMTVQEYLESSRWRRSAYRLARNPFILFCVAPVYLFLFRQRFSAPDRNRREQRSGCSGWVSSPTSCCSSSRSSSPAQQASGFFTSSTSSKKRTGSAPTIGTTPPRRCAVARTTTCRGSCAG